MIITASVPQMLPLRYPCYAPGGGGGEGVKGQKMAQNKNYSHSTPNGAKFLRLGHDPSQNFIKICQVGAIYKIW